MRLSLDILSARKPAKTRLQAIVASGVAYATHSLFSYDSRGPEAHGYLRRVANATRAWGGCRCHGTS